MIPPFQRGGRGGSQYNLPPFGKKLIYAKNRKTLNKPAETVQPDRLDLEEWQLNEVRPTHEDLEETLMGRCPADVANALTVGMSVARRLEVRELLNGGKRSETPAEELRRWSAPSASGARVPGSPRKRR